MQRPGLFLFNSERRLNTYSGKPLEPAVGHQTFGPHSGCPMLSAFQDHFFKLHPRQRDAMLVWLKYYFTSAFEWTPRAGQWAVFTGCTGSGKTFFSRHVIGRLVGGFFDATKILVGGSQFTSMAMKWPHWCVDDECMSSFTSREDAMKRFKALIANQEQLWEGKFKDSALVAWLGRMLLTTNTDYSSLRVLSDLDINTMDKLCLFRCTEDESDRFPFLPSMIEMQKQLEKELPYYARALLDWKVPDDFAKDSRFGYAPFHNEFLLDRIHQGSSAAPFKEVLLKTLAQWFMANPEATEFAGTSTDLYALIMSDGGLNQMVLKNYSIEKINRHLESLQKMRLITFSTRSGAGKSRVWVFPAPPKSLPPPEPPAPSGPNPFEKV